MYSGRSSAEASSNCNLSLLKSIGFKWLCPKETWRQQNSNMVCINFIDSNLIKKRDNKVQSQNPYLFSCHSCFVGVVAFCNQSWDSIVIFDYRCCLTRFSLPENASLVALLSFAMKKSRNHHL